MSFIDWTHTICRLWLPHKPFRCEFNNTKYGCHNPDNYDIDTHGQLTGIIRYFTPYQDQHNQPITISFGLGENVAVNSIIGWPAILDMNMDLSVSTMSITSHTLHRNFPITCRQSTVGPPPGNKFDTAAFLRDRRTHSALSLVTHTTNSPVLCTPIPGVFDDFSEGFGRRNISTDMYIDHLTTKNIISLSSLHPSYHNNTNPPLPSTQTAQRAHQPLVLE